MAQFGPYYKGELEPDMDQYDGPHEPYFPSIWQRGCIAHCVCGWHPNNHPGFILADHLAAMTGGDA